MDRPADEVKSPYNGIVSEYRSYGWSPTGQSETHSLYGVYIPYDIWQRYGRQTLVPTRIALLWINLLQGTPFS